MNLFEHKSNICGIVIARNLWPLLLRTPARKNGFRTVNGALVGKINENHTLSAGDPSAFVSNKITYGFAFSETCNGGSSWDSPCRIVANRQNHSEYLDDPLSGMVPTSLKTCDASRGQSQKP
jgi:hypothetical protein